MVSANNKIEYFFIFSLLVWFFVGNENFLNILLAIQLVLIFFFIELKINYLKLITTIILSIIIFIFSDTLNSIKIYFMVILIILSFNFKERINHEYNFKLHSFFIIIFIISIFFNMNPHVNNYLNKWKINDVSVFEKNDEVSIEKKIYLKKNNYIEYIRNPVCPKICRIDTICDKNLCSVSKSYLKNRFTINNVDVNFVSIILLTILFLSLLNSSDRKYFYISTYIILGLIVLILTKSRAGLLFYLVSIGIYYFKYIDIKKIIIFFIFSHIAIVFVGFIMVNSVENPMMMSDPKISKDAIINLPISKNLYGDHGSARDEYFDILRLITFFDSSNYIRFSSFFQTYLIYLNDFSKILLPDHRDLISDINYETMIGKIFFIKSSDYDPHNFFMDITKEIGLIGSLYFYYLLFSLFKFNRYKVLFTPLVFSSIFLGTAVLYLVPTILIFCFQKNYNFLNYLKIIK